MPDPVFFEKFSEDLNAGVHQLNAADHELKLMLTNTAPDHASDTVFADITEISAGNGYTAGGKDIQNDLSRTGDTTTLVAVDVTWTASGGSIGPFRYAVLYNNTPASPAKPLICSYDRGSEYTVPDGDGFTTDFLSDGVYDLTF